MITLSRLVAQLAEKYNTSKRPLRYFDVPKRGELSPKDIKYVKSRFKDLVERELCVEKDPENPDCYTKSKSDEKPRRRKRKSSYLADYEDVFRDSSVSTKDFLKTFRDQIPKGRAPQGLKRIAVETGLPLPELKEVYDIGIGAYASSGSRTGMTAEQWGYGRVYAFIMCYFGNADGTYNNRRFLKNKTDFHIFEKIMDKWV